jgi:hypothetical protein
MLKMMGAALVLLLASTGAEAACNLTGQWDGYFVLSAADESGGLEGGSEFSQAPLVAVRCAFSIKRDGRLGGAFCKGWRSRSQVDVTFRSEVLKLDRKCRLAPTSLFFEVQGDTPDHFTCRPHGTMDRRQGTVNGLAACGWGAEPFTLVRR